MKRAKHIHPDILAQRDARLAEYRSRGYSFLAEAIRSSDKGAANLELIDVRAPHNEEYKIEVTALWDDKPEIDIRVVADLVPIPSKPFLGVLPIYFRSAAEDFIIRPDGTFVDESDE